ncbi:MAG: PleD family two-component system response regulator [Alphaproteobacteria bacterium]|nr:PleD family two-component system response regulator [Alphaproteobacteria bacterium]
MTARVLVVDDILPNIRLLEARLMAEYFDVLQATSGPEALAICAAGHCDIVLLDVMMPGMDGFEVCRRLKADPATAHIPVVMVTALDQPADRVRGLDAGADDFLTKPVNEVALIARVRSLARLKNSLDELRQRVLTAAALGASTTLAQALMDEGREGRILLVDDRASSVKRIEQALSPHHSVTVVADAQEALFSAAEGDFELVVISLGLKDYDGLRLCSQLRTLERTRQIPVLLISDSEDQPKVLRGLDLGVNDYLNRPIDRNELLARVRTQIRRARYGAALRHDLQASIDAALIDQLTGLHNRRYLETHLPAMMHQAKAQSRTICLMILNIDHFKMVNDTWGHDAGDDVLKGFAQRVKRVIRNADLICRIGGEEFIVIMPDTTMDVAALIAERVRGAVQAELFRIRSGAADIPVTVSIGLADECGNPDPDQLVRRADQALYRSKHEGRNRVTQAAA